MSENAWGARIFVCCRNEKAPQLYFRALDLRKADARSIICMSIVPGSTDSPSGLLKKKLWFIMCCHFSVPPFDSKKKSFDQKVSNSFKKFRLFKFRRVPVCRLYWNPFTFGLLWNRVSTFLNFASRFDFLLTKWIFTAPQFGTSAINYAERATVRTMIVTLWRGDLICRHNLCPVNISFTFLISPASGVQIWRRIRIFNQKLDLGMICYPSLWHEHFTTSGPVSIR